MPKFLPETDDVIRCPTDEKDSDEGDRDFDGVQLGFADDARGAASQGARRRVDKDVVRGGDGRLRVCGRGRGGHRVDRVSSSVVEAS